MASPAPAPRLQTIVIVGSGAAAWLAAAALRRSFPVNIKIVEPVRFDHGVGVGEVAEALLPPFVPFLARLGVTEAALVRGAQAGFSLGTLFTGWAGDGGWFQPFGDLGAPIGPVAYHQLVLRLRAEGIEAALEHASLGAVMARGGRFAHPSADPRSPLSSLSYGLHISLDGLTALLRQATAGVEVVKGRFRAADREEDGRVASLSLDDGATVAGDLFIDCSGAASLLRSGRFENWSHWLRCDTIAALPRAANDDAAPFPTFAADTAGWTRTVPLAGGNERIGIYSSEHRGGGDSAIAYRPGMQAEPWTGNVVAIGSSAVALEPIARTGFHLVQTGIERLLRLLPVGDGRVEAAEYNRLAREEAEGVRDFAILPYKLNGRHGEPFWDARRAMDVPDRLARKIDQYRSRGRVPLEDGETFERDAWVSMFDGLGLTPRRYDPLTDGLTSDEVRRHVHRIQDILSRTAAGLPAHRYTLKRMRGQ